VRERAIIERDADGKPRRGLGTVQDITLRKQTEAALQEERRVRDTLLESIPGVFYAIDAKGIFTFWNHHFEQVTGRSAEELSHFNALDFSRARIAGTLPNASSRSSWKVRAISKPAW
jgi:PAS domain-containing protein